MKSIQYMSNSCSNEYRFAFNGQEKDQEIYNNQSTTTATFWEYDGRIGRRWNRDPKPTVGISDYAVMRNNPIWFNDPMEMLQDGLKIKEQETKHGIPKLTHKKNLINLHTINHNTHMKDKH